MDAKNRAPWETDVTFSISGTPEVLDPDTNAFVEDMSDNWEQRRKRTKREEKEERLLKMKEKGKSFYSLENVKRDYKVMKQKVKEIEKMEESKLGDSVVVMILIDSLTTLLTTLSFSLSSGNNDKSNSQPTDSSDVTNKPDGWETSSKAQDGNIWEMT
uniref:Uncharacterized protein n=1 Tax=Lactuca sativa TaxID=4236 RepID=A0A9R1UTL6_LACSA|nr:hypothetical protein LSAT_V11C800410850 [Lactuca sativa]